MTAETRLRLAAIVESSHDAIFSKTLDGLVLSWNAAAQRIFGCSAAEVVGGPSAMLLPPELEDESEGLLLRFKAGERIDRYKTTRVTKAGKTVTVFLTITPLVDSAGALVGVAEILADVTDQEQAERALSNLSRRLIHAQEEERARIARDLHDDIGQRLSLLAIELTELSATGPTVHHGSRTIKLRNQAADIATDVQALAYELHSSRLELLGLATATSSFCDEFGKQQHFDVHFTARDVPPHLPWDVSLSLFRIVQEAVYNSAKHSGVQHCAVQLWGAPDGIHLIVSDTGKGFDLEAARAGRGLGLVSMDERLKLVDGDLEIDTQPQRGTRIHARAPVRSGSVLA